MTLVGHILRKDFRHTWIYVAAATVLLILWAWSFNGFLAVHRGGFLGPVDGVLILAWALFCAVLMHGERLPGERQYWLTRPIRWQNLLQAKTLLLLAAVVAPVALVHSWVIVSRGFPLLENLGGIVWNALLLGMACLVPVAVVASISRNLQQLILWALGISAGALALRQFLVGFPQEMRWVPNAVTIALGVLAGAAIVIWQYATRRTVSGRVVVVAYFLLLATIDFWPVSIWYAVQRAASPTRVDDSVARLKVDEGQLVWHRFRIGDGRAQRSYLYIPLRVEGLPEGWSVELNGWGAVYVEAGIENDRYATGTHRALLEGEGAARSISLAISPDFAERHPYDPMDISISAELTVYEAPRHFSMSVDEEATIPGIGRCRSQVVGFLSIDCQSVFEGRLRVAGQWATGTQAKGSLVVLSREEERSPIRLVPSIHPISFIWGGFGARSDYSSGRISISTRKPVAHVQRKIELRGIRLAEITR
ncbi:MAG: hypothetical protein ACKV2U_23540 [Bryobacteraceae bacterium]